MKNRYFCVDLGCVVLDLQYTTTSDENAIESEAI